MNKPCRHPQNYIEKEEKKTKAKARKLQKAKIEEEEKKKQQHEETQQKDFGRKKTAAAKRTRNRTNQRCKDLEGVKEKQERPGAARNSLEQPGAAQENNSGAIQEQQ